jgi:polysaccharide deacetylase
MTGFDGFRKVPMTNGVFECKFNPPLDKRKVLMSLKVDHHRSTKLLIKDTNAK